MVVAAHPDDELLGPGATLNKLVNEYGCHVHVVILGEGLTSRAETRDVGAWENELREHRRSIDNAKAEIGYQTLAIHQFPDNRFDSVDLLDITKAVEKEKRAHNPEVIFTHHGNDTNIDHCRTFDAVITACRPVVSEQVRTIITFETPSSTEWQAFNKPNPFLPNLFFSVSSGNVEAKKRALACYQHEMRPYPHPRSAQALEIISQRWGIAVGCEHAEAFMLIRSGPH